MLHEGKDQGDDAVSKKPTKKDTAETVVVAGVVAATQAPVFTPCVQCSYPADCARAAKCSKGFK